jgi:hypothetical protein
MTYDIQDAWRFSRRLKDINQDYKNLIMHDYCDIDPAGPDQATR